MAAGLWLTAMAVYSIVPRPLTSLISGGAIVLWFLVGLGKAM
jgi:hypothetical protein